ncbi:hypothetical protein IDH44_17930 [Paenibacillus sp. IB182496]|uniref:Uncharacterized protein n=1 Tax=Paenibacillus sabuli TaxID=2772509 RepID=A0A927GT85_9BACL|nr:hypothetical protein [Paenibacillus sabuli]MBD2847081.1 hypothetical protein [Paenibacillus sabuli]
MIDQRRQREEQDRQYVPVMYYLLKIVEPSFPIVVIFGLFIFIFRLVQLIEEHSSVWIRFNIILFGVSCLVALSFIVFIWQRAVRREMIKHGAFRWIRIVLIIVAPALEIILKRCDLAWLTLTVQAAAFVYVAVGKTPKQIIRF